MDLRFQENIGDICEWRVPTIIAVMWTEGDAEERFWVDRHLARLREAQRREEQKPPEWW